MPSHKLQQIHRDTKETRLLCDLSDCRTGKARAVWSVGGGGGGGGVDRPGGTTPSRRVGVVSPGMFIREAWPSV